MSIKIENTETHGWEAAIRGMRNPMNSWDKSDSEYVNNPIFDEENSMLIHDNPIFHVGENDLDLMKRLHKAGTDHRKFMRMITVSCDISAPLYWWKEFDTYKVGTVANSCSTMHKIHATEFGIGDFSFEYISMNQYDKNNVKTQLGSENDLIIYTIGILNKCRELYLKTKDKQYWYKMIQLLPSSYNQKRTVMMNYEVLANIYKSRKNHKLNEWHEFCHWIEKLSYAELILGRE